MSFSALVFPSLAPDRPVAANWSENFSYLERSPDSFWTWINDRKVSASIALHDRVARASIGLARFVVHSAGGLSRNLNLASGDFSTNVLVRDLARIVFPIRFVEGIACLKFRGDQDAEIVGDNRALSFAIADLEVVSADGEILISRDDSYAPIDGERTVDVNLLRGRLHEAGFFKVDGMRGSTNGITRSSPLCPSFGLPTDPISATSRQRLFEDRVSRVGAVTWLHADQLAEPEDWRSSDV